MQLLPATLLAGTLAMLPAEPFYAAAVEAQLDETALLGLRRWRLRPSLRDGVPVESLRIVGVGFQIEGHEFEK